MNYDDVLAAQRKVQQEYESASRCPVCGTKKGFAWGTGDCGCNEDYQSPSFDQW